MQSNESENNIGNHGKLKVSFILVIDVFFLNIVCAFIDKISLMKTLIIRLMSKQLKLWTYITVIAIDLIYVQVRLFPMVQNFNFTVPVINAG